MKKKRIEVINKKAVKRIVVLLVVIAVIVVMIVRMPGRSYDGPRPPIEGELADLRDELKRDVVYLAGVIGERTVVHFNDLSNAALYIESEFRASSYQPARQEFEVRDKTVWNIEAELPGTEHADEIIVIGAHYDSSEMCPSANDNASGVAAMLALARHFATNPMPRTVRFVAFVNEEPPYFWTKDMGSLVYAKRCKARDEDIVGMLSLETIGYYTDEPDSQHYPFPFNLLYPSEGNFVGFIGNTSSRSLVRSCIGSFRKTAKMPSEGAAIPGIVREAGYSDHWSFWQQGYPAIMVTDTAFFRYPHYHMPLDTPDKIDFDGLTLVSEGLKAVVHDLASR